MEASFKKSYASLGADRLVLLWLGVWWIANLVQAGFTELANDEAYYHMFAERLAWGYFDHPPVTALLVWAGERLFGGELGVRFFFTVLQPLYLWILWRLIRPADAGRRDAALFVVVSAATLMLQLYGFIAVPDGPLMFTTALFLLTFKWFSENRRRAWLWMGISGAGKSQALVHLGIAASRQGYRVVHFQLEGTREQAMARYDSAWLGGIYQDVKVGNISDTKLKMAQRVVAKLGKTDIIVVAVESFGGMTVTQMRQELQDIERAYGKVDMILWDYLELAELGDGHSYSMNEERFRQMKLAQQAKMLAMEFNAVVHVATQANGIPPELLNDPDFVITRYNLAEAKGKVNPMDGFVTMNFTSDERKEEIMRLYLDKAREHKAGDIIRICNNMTYSRFYDRKRTLEMPWEDIVEEQHATKTKRGRRNTSVDDDE